MKRLKQIVKKFSILMLYLFLCLIFLPVTVPVLLASALLFWGGKLFKAPNITKYGYCLALAYDHFANVAIFLGSPRETISSRLGKAKKSGRYLWWVPYLAVLVDWLAFAIAGDRNHTDTSIIEESQKFDEIISWIK